MIQFPIINYNQMKTNGISPILTFPMVVSFPCFQPINTLANFSFNNEISKIKIDESQKNHRQHFTHEEDEKIKILVETYGTKSWSVIASFIEGKNAKQCRDRYSNYLVPGFFQGEWSKEEDEILIKLYNEHGSKWSLIQKQFPNRSSNAIKNRWYYFLNKKNDDNHDKITQTDSTNELINQIQQLTTTIPPHEKKIDDNKNEDENIDKTKSEKVFVLSDSFDDSIDFPSDDEWFAFD